MALCTDVIFLGLFVLGYDVFWKYFIFLILFVGCYLYVRHANRKPDRHFPAMVLLPAKN